MRRRVLESVCACHTPMPGRRLSLVVTRRHRIAFQRAYGSDIRRLTVAIWVANVDGSHARQVTKPPSGSEDHSPSWSPDGRYLVIDRIDDAAPNGARGNIYTIGADGKGLRLVYRAPSRWPAGGAEPRWSPD